ncbi:MULTISPECIES: cob(I)yrinic acid a,c-diamide adenosyltransferase [Nitrincola]|uniref:Corrinoid adenosyltransferase n=1 Tax=Nitrincola nitratireducens TaxID=1229521 RepID=W9V753_9GAMM|nr:MULTISPECIES: cob(I)yrinic acid a,c-diamide adenosyltransferase [Nitrincola]EXJ12736.1 Cob(I)yrinic acid a,c-diamide adenosyltransferase [Nitrincola nitratireducens]
MADRLTRIYTRSGDKGTTGLANGSRVPKYHPRIEALGDVDELNSLIGLLISELESSHPLLSNLQTVQNDLFDLGGELAIADKSYTVIQLETVNRLEHWLDILNDELPPLKEFILPGGNRAAATAHLARTVCRRSERRMVELASIEDETINPMGAAYLNRLSDYLFVTARFLAREKGGREVLWQPSSAREN